MPLEKRQRRYLQIALVVIGSVFLFIYPLMQLWPSGWVWLPRQTEYEQMMIGVSGTLGIFYYGHHAILRNISASYGSHFGPVLSMAPSWLSKHS
jgi:hypothetical protein